MDCSGVGLAAALVRFQTLLSPPGKSGRYPTGMIESVAQLL